jgi:hypothetical protein
MLEVGLLPLLWELEFKEFRMKNLFITQDDEIIVNFVVAQTKEGRLVADVVREMLRGYPDLDEESIEQHQAVFRRPSFKDLVELTGNINLQSSATTTVNFNPFASRLLRMERLIKRWTLKNGDRDMPATSDSVEQLNPVLANVIGAQLETELGGI